MRQLEQLSNIPMILRREVKHSVVFEVSPDTAMPVKTLYLQKWAWKALGAPQYINLHITAEGK